jgi:large subunit ribosomal protein L20
MRSTSGPVTTRRHKRVLERAKGFRGGRSKLFRTAKETVMRAERFAFAHRRRKKRDFRRLWITRLSAAAEQHGMKYSRLIDGLNKAGIVLNRKELSELAIHDPKVFEQIVGQAKAALGAAA